MTATPASRALITGGAGQVGLALQAKVPSGWTVVACGVDQLDVTRPDQVREVLRRERPAVVIHTAAYTAVDAAESDVATGRVGECPRHGARGRGSARSGRAAAVRVDRFRVRRR